MLELKSRKKDKNLPVLILNTSGKCEGNFYLRVEGRMMSFKKDFLKAFDTYIKTNILFQIAFPTELKDFVNFIFECFMKEGKPSKKTVQLINELQQIDPIPTEKPEENFPQDNLLTSFDNIYFDNEVTI